MGILFMVECCRICKCRYIIWDPLHSNDGKYLSWGYTYGVCGALGVYRV